MKGTERIGRRLEAKEEEENAMGGNAAETTVGGSVGTLEGGMERTVIDCC